MANSYYYIDGGGNTRTLYIAGTSTTTIVLRGSEYGYGWPETEPTVETTPNRLGHAYRAMAYAVREYGFKFHLIGTNATGLDALKGTWRGYHNTEFGQGYVKRVTAGGTTRCLDCIPLATEWEENKGFTVTGDQRYLAAWPWWRSEAVSTAADAFNGTNAVTVTCTNGGDIPSPVYAVITGVIETPKITASDGTYIEVSKTTANADDTLIINCRPYGTNRLTVKYYEHGAGAGVFCAVTGNSRPISHPTGTTNMTLTAASGTATIDFSWYLYYGSLY